MIEDQGIVAGNVTDKYGTRNPIARWLMGRFLGAVSELWDRTDGATALEVGCGEGELAARLAARRPVSFVGTDLSPKIIAEAQARYPDLTFEVRSATDLGYADDSFDTVVACEVLEHLPDPEAALRELTRVARRHVLLSVPREPIWRAMNMARGSYWGDLGNTPGHIQHWGRRAFLALIRRHLEIVEVRAPLPWTMVLGRVR